MTVKEFFWQNIRLCLRQQKKMCRSAACVLLAGNSAFTIWFLASVYQQLEQLPADGLAPAALLDVTRFVQRLGLSFFAYAAVGVLLAGWLCLAPRRKTSVRQRYDPDAKALPLSVFGTVGLMLAGTAGLQFFLVGLSIPFFSAAGCTFQLGAVGGAIAGSFTTALALTAVCIFCAVQARGIRSYVGLVLLWALAAPCSGMILLHLPQLFVPQLAVWDGWMGYLFPVINAGLVAAGSGAHGIQAFCMLLVCVLMLGAATCFVSGEARSRRIFFAFFRLVLQCVGFAACAAVPLCLEQQGRLERQTASWLVLALCFAGVALTGALTMGALRLSPPEQRKAGWLQWSVCSVLIVAAGCVLQFGMAGFSTRLPAVQEVASVTFDDRRQTDSQFQKNQAAGRELCNLFFYPGKDVSSFRMVQGGKKVRLESPAAIEAVLALHQQSLSKQQEVRSFRNTCVVTYHLRDGSRLTRRLIYADAIQDDTSSYALDALHNEEQALNAAYCEVLYTEEYVRKTSPLFLLESQNCIGLRSGNGQNVLTGEKKVRQLLTVFREELLAYVDQPAETLVQAGVNVQLYYNQGQVNTAALRVLDDDAFFRLHFSCLYQLDAASVKMVSYQLPACFIRTRSLLEAYGYDVQPDGLAYQETAGIASAGGKA